MKEKKNRIKKCHTMSPSIIRNLNYRIPFISLKISSFKYGPARPNILVDIEFFSVNVSSVVFVIASTCKKDISPSQIIKRLFI